MSYSNAEINFSGIHVACLVGVNGAGKSSLLDAITWALWEEGRARTDELIRLGQSEMTCELEFFMEDELYRVYRSRAKAYKNVQGKSNLEFQLFNPKEKNWISLSKSSTRQTQDFITKTLKMDYGTFVNSVYLRQGKADEFTVKGPSERKQILADILGLEVYDKLCESARVKLREIDQNVSLEQNLILDLKSKISKEDELRISLENITCELNKEEKGLKNMRDLLNLREKELNEKKEKEKQIQTLDKSRESQKSLIQTLESQLSNIKNKEEKYKELINKKTQINKEYSDYLSLKEKFNLLESDKEQHNKLLTEKTTLEQELKEKIKQTEQDLAVYKSKINDRNKQRNNLEEKLKYESKFINFLPKAEKEIGGFYGLKDLLKQIETEGLELKYKKDLLRVDLDKLTEKEREIENKVKTLGEHNHSEPCPLCKSPIKDKEKVIETYKNELNSLDKKEQTLFTNIDLIEEEVIKKRKKYNEVKEKINNFGKDISLLMPSLEEVRQERIDEKLIENVPAEQAISFLSSQIEISKSEFQRAKEQIATLDKEIDDYNLEVVSLKKLLDSGSLVKEISLKLSDISRELNNLKYSQEDYDELKSSLKEKESIVLTHNLLNQAESELVSLTDEKNNLTQKVRSSKKELEELEALILENKKQVEDIQTLSSEVEEIKQNEAMKATSVQEVKRRQILTQQELLEIEDSKKILQYKETKIQSALNDKKNYEILEKAFSKNGIQVAIIETVVPEIEKEANRILNRLTENQMHIALKTQREKKTTSGLVETLDVVIADDVGTRNYELYSGGEAFKIDFSLRLALSRLLANRAGARLQTLIIDEGFGSQDSSGKERLLEVIRSIESEFELILVVTHLDELKESFPAQIQVMKDEEGSKVRLVA